MTRFSWLDTASITGITETRISSSISTAESSTVSGRVKPPSPSPVTRLTNATTRIVASIASNGVKRIAAHSSSASGRLTRPSAYRLPLRPAIQIDARLEASITVQPMRSRRPASPLQSGMRCPASRPSSSDSAGATAAMPRMSPSSHSRSARPPWIAGTMPASTSPTVPIAALAADSRMPPRSSSSPSPISSRRSRRLRRTYQPASRVARVLLPSE